MNKETFNWIEERVKNGTPLQDFLTKPSLYHQLTDGEYKILVKEYVMNSGLKRPVKDVLNNIWEFELED